jgi:hypothetical protein
VNTALIQLFVTFLQKHHYRELSEEAQQSLGEIPDKFIDYWTQHFPLLLLHTWITMQCVKSEPIFSHYYHKDYMFSHSLYVKGSKDVFSTHSNVMQQWMKKQPPTDTAKKNKVQVLTDIYEQQHFEQNNFQATRDSDMSPNIRRRNDRSGNRRENLQKRFQNTGRFSRASKFENWRAEDDPVRQLYQKMDLGKARDDVNTTDHQIPYHRDSPEKLVSWRDVGEWTGSRKTLDKTVSYEDSDSLHKSEPQKIDNFDVKRSEISGMENPLLLAVGYERQTHPSWRQQTKQVKNDIRNRSVKKRHRHKSAEVPAVWMLPDPLPPRSD